MGNATQTKANAPSTQNTASLYKEKAEWRSLDEFSIDNANSGGNNVGRNDVQGQLHHATNLGHQLGHFQSSQNSVSSVQPKANCSNPIQCQSYSVEDDEKMASYSVGMTSPDAPMSIPVLSSSPKLNTGQAVGMTSPEAPMSVVDSSPKPSKRRSSIRSEEAETGNSSFLAPVDSVSDAFNSEPGKLLSSVNNFYGAKVSSLQRLGDTALYGVLNPGKSKIADFVARSEYSGSLINNVNSASQTGKFIGKLGKGLGGIGVLSSGFGMYNASRRGSSEDIVQSSSDTIASLIGFLGPVGGAYSAGYSVGQLLDKGVDVVGDAITGDSDVDHSASGGLGKLFYSWFGEEDAIPRTRKRGL
ncbi:MAG: hypothetical protein F6K42_15165 [Leptolyngbya sp. SIO1D8]|nr:hypothetical protein [Leptolyngbya sp. SIO1D8]